MPQDLYNLPQGWEWKSFGEVSDVYAGSSAPQGDEWFKNGQHPFVRTKDLGRYGITDALSQTDDRINDHCVEIKKPRLAKQGAVLFPKSGASILTNSRAILARDAYVTSHLCVVDGGHDTTNRFLFYYLCRIDMADLCENPAYPSLKVGKVKEYPVPLPPLAEQERIVEKLDALFRRIDDASNRLNQILTHSQALFASALDEILGAGKWPTSELGSKVKIQSGTGFPKKYQGASDEEFPFLKVSDMNLAGNETRILSWNNSISEETAKLIKAKVMPAGTIIFPKIGAAIATNKKRMLSVPSAYDNNVMGLVPSEEVLPEHLFWYMQSIDLSDWASASALPSMKASTVKEHEIPLPPLEEQHRIVEHLDGLSERVQGLEKTTRDRIDHLAALKASLLDAAFRGEL